MAPYRELGQSALAWGHLYIPSLQVENNIADALDTKLKDVETHERRAALLQHRAIIVMMRSCKRTGLVA